MVYYATKKDGEVTVFDLSNVNYNNLTFSNPKSNVINKIIRKQIIDGTLPSDIDAILGISFSNLLYMEMNEKNTMTFLTNPSVFASILRKELKPFVYWLNEYIDVDDVYEMLNSLVNTLIRRLNNQTINPISDKLEDFQNSIESNLFN